MVAETQERSLGDIIKERLLAAAGTAKEIQQNRQQLIETGGTTLVTRQREYVQLDELRRQIEELQGQVKERQDQLAPQILEDMAEQGMQKVTIDGYTLFQRTDRFVSKKGDITQNEMCEILKQCGWGYLVAEGYNAQRLKSAVLEAIAKRDIEEDEAGVPIPVLERLNVGEQVRLVATKA